MLCNGTEQKNPEARSGLSLVAYHCTSLHNIRHGIGKEPAYGKRNAQAGTHERFTMDLAEIMSW